MQFHTKMTNIEKKLMYFRPKYYKPINRHQLKKHKKNFNDI